MRTTTIGAVLITTLVTCLFSAPAAQAQATRTWVSGVGDDANPCSRTAPCKTFAGAISKTATFGEIDCLDPGGFGGVTIIKSITIDCGAVTGGILVSGTNGVVVNGANAIVILRNLTIFGLYTGTNGINFIQGSALELDNVTVYGFGNGAATGVNFAPNSANASLMINHSKIMANGIAPATGQGIAVAPAVGGSAVVIINKTQVENNSNGIAAASTNGAITMTVRDSAVSNNHGNGIITAGANPINLMIDRSTVSNSIGGTGLNASGAAATIRINSSVITGNTTGVTIAGGAVVRSYKNNAVNGNAGGEPVLATETPD